MDQGDGVEIAGREFFIERGGIDVLAPIDLERLGRLSAAEADIEPGDSRYDRVFDRRHQAYG